MLAVLAPGQGAQKPGFLTPWLDLPGVARRLGGWSELAGVDLVRLGTAADAEEIKDTARTQPLLVAAALLVAEQLLGPAGGSTAANGTAGGGAAGSGTAGGAAAGSADGRGGVVVAGHSVGEVGAAAIAGVLTPEAAITFAAVRGREMAAACALEPTGMSALLGGDPEEVVAALDAAGLYPANRNGAGQIVAAGALPALAAFEPPTRVRVIPLQVAGAFHTPFMAPAEKALAEAAAGLATAAPRRPVLSNLDGTVVTDGATLLGRLVAQVTAPVRWDLCLATLHSLGVTAVIELAPAGTLAGLVKRELKGTEILTLNTPDDLPAAHDLLTRQTSQ